MSEWEKIIEKRSYCNSLIRFNQKLTNELAIFCKIIPVVDSPSVTFELSVKNAIQINTIRINILFEKSLLKFGCHFEVNTFSQNYFTSTLIQRMIKPNRNSDSVWAHFFSIEFNFCW